MYGRLGIPAEREGVAPGVAAQIPLERFGTPVEVASAVAYLAALECAFVVISELVIGGDMSQL